MTLSPGGVLSGTPTAAGFSNINFTVFDGVDTVSIAASASTCTRSGSRRRACCPTRRRADPTARRSRPPAAPDPSAFHASGLPNGLSIDPFDGCDFRDRELGRRFERRQGVGQRHREQQRRVLHQDDVDRRRRNAGGTAVDRADRPRPSTTARSACRALAPSPSGTAASAPFAWTALGSAAGHVVRFGGNGDTTLVRHAGRRRAVGHADGGGHISTCS